MPLANIIQKAEKDAAAARLADPNRNPFQRAQDFLRTKLAKLTAKPITKPLTLKQKLQAAADVAAKNPKKQQKAKNVKELSKIGKVVTSVPRGTTSLALMLTSDSDQSTKWKKLGYKSPEDYKNALLKYEQETGRSAETGELTGTYGGIPKSADIKTQYPDGIPTGVGGPNAGQAQSSDSEAPAYIPPASAPAPIPAPVKPTPDPTPVETEIKPDLAKPVDFIPYDATIATGAEYERYIPGYRENPLTAGSMKGDHRHINPRQKAILARKEMLDRSRERKNFEKNWTDAPVDFNTPKIVDLNLKYPGVVDPKIERLF